MAVGRLARPRGAPDAGIDLVAEDRDGGLWAIQAKHYDPAYAIKKADLDSFLSRVVAAGVHLPAADRHDRPSGPDRAADARRAGEAGRDAAALATWRRSRSSGPLDRAPAPREAEAEEATPASARGDQATCVAGSGRADRGQLVMACGTGKTLVGPLPARRARRRSGRWCWCRRCRWSKQTLREWFTVGRLRLPRRLLRRHRRTQDDGTRSSPRPASLAFPVTTDPDEIAAFLRRRDRRARVVFATYQSSPQIADAQTGSDAAFDLVIADEAHRCAGPEAGVFATVLDPAKIKARKRLFMTATPRYFTGRVRKEASEADWEIASMDDEHEVRPGAPPAHLRPGHRPGPALRLPGRRRRCLRHQPTGRWRSGRRSSPPTARRSPTPAPSPANSDCCGRCETTTCTGSSPSTRGSARAREFATSLPEVSRGCPRAAARAGRCGRSTSRGR